MRLIVNDRTFPFGPETRLGKAVDLLVLVLLLALLVHTVRQALAGPAPEPPTVVAPRPAPARHLVFTVQPDGRWTLNGQLVPPDAFETELARAMAGREVRVLFVTADASRPYGDVIEIVERARRAGINAALLPPP